MIPCKPTVEQLERETRRIEALTLQILEAHPFWGYLLLQVRLVPAPSLPSYAATDVLRHIWYNPVMTCQLTNRELGFVLLHEVCHQVLATTARCNNRDQFKWNCATDYAINDMIANFAMKPGAGVSDQFANHRVYQMPEGTLYKPKYHEQIAEVIYEDLCHQNLPSPPLATVLLPGKNGNDIFVPGTCIHNGGIDIHLPLDLPLDKEENLFDRMHAATESYYVNDERGDIPGELLRRLEELSAPRLSWRRLLHCYADAILSGDDYSLARPNKRYLVNGLVVPGRYSESISSLVVSLDTSGSMSDEELHDVTSEISGMLPDAQDITLIVADDMVQQVITFDRLEDFLKRPRFPGGGGTDHVCVFDYIAKHHLNPQLFIGLTDLYSNFPKRRPLFPVIWLTPEDHGNPPWGKVIVVKDN